MARPRSAGFESALIVAQSGRRVNVTGVFERRRGESPPYRRFSSLQATHMRRVSAVRVGGWAVPVIATAALLASYVGPPSRKAPPPT